MDKKRMILNIVGVFETGKPADYQNVTFMKNDTGQLSYGSHQTSLMSGNLYKLIKLYVASNGAYSTALNSYLERFAEKDYSLNTDKELHELLRKAGADPVMMAVQDNFFDIDYFLPAKRIWDTNKFVYPVSLLIVFDSKIHGGFDIVSKGLSTDNEIDFCYAYVDRRRQWLINKSALLAKTVYRMDTIKTILDNKNYQLDPPIVANGVVVGGTTAPTTFTVLKLSTPYMTGNSVKHAQELLVAKGFNLDPDGVFGNDTYNAVREFQKNAGLTVDGVIGAKTMALLEK